MMYITYIERLPSPLRISPRRWQAYRGHFTEAGWNGIEFTDTSQCWARNITILNGDNLLSVYRSSFCTIANITTGV